MSYMVPPIRLTSDDAPTILIVDDIPSNLELLEAIFVKEGFNVITALNAQEALDLYNKHTTDLAVLDVMMPGMNGFELCRELKNCSSRNFFPVVLVTALNDSRSRITGIDAGADDFISKPFVTSELTSKIRALLRLRSLHKELDHSENIIMTLAVAMEARDSYTKGHSTRVGDMSARFGSFLGLSERDQEALKKAGILHDVGKIGISEQILNKPDKLSDEEAEIIKTHPVIGEDICRHLQSLQSILPGIRSHHERWDGEGFPQNLSGDDIPLMARILSIVDSFDAMVSARPYRERKSAAGALGVMAEEHHSGQWDPALVEVFLAMMNTIS